MDKLTNLTGFSSGNKSLNILHAQNELDKKKKTYHSVNLSKLPDKGAKLKKQIDDLENLLQNLSLETASVNELTCSAVSSTSNESASIGKKNPIVRRKEAVHDKGKSEIISNNDEDKNNNASGDSKVKKGKPHDNNMPFCKVSSDPGPDEFLSFSDLTPKPKEKKSDDKTVDNNPSDDSKVKNGKPHNDNMPFCKVSSDSGSNKFLSFSDLTPKHKEKKSDDKTDAMSSPSFKNWRPTGEIRKALLTEPKPLVEKPAAKYSSLDHFNFNPVFQASEECIKKIHSSLATYPDECQEETKPEGLRTELMLHQKRGLAFMIWREEQDPKGGILADDMGLGKTLSMIALILKQKESEVFCSRQDEDIECRGTLIVCSASIIHQWDAEIIKHCEIGALKVLLYHGPKRDRDVKRMKSYDVVLTTYNIVQMEKKKMDGDKIASPLFSLKWERIILDEAHTIKNHNSQTAQAIFSLRSFRKWAVTGTPIHNIFKDVYALVKFLQFSPFDDPKKFKKLTDDDAETSLQRRNLLMKSIVLRRTKDQVDEWGKPLIEMKNKSLSPHYIELAAEERKTYDKLNDKVKNKFNQYLEKTSKMTSLLVLLLRLQQCCNHLGLLKKDLEVSNDPSDVADALSSLTIDESSCSSSDSGLDLTFTNLDEEKLDDVAFKSTKIAELFKELHKIFESSDDKDKCVIVSQWTSMLEIIAFHLKEESIDYHLIAGSTKVEDRQKFAHDFNTNEDGAKVMLLSLKAGGVGLNLIGASHLFLMDLHWNPALEKQACDRIHRVGQKKDVVIHKFICKNTIEEKINELQNIKNRIASSALSGTKQDTSRLTVEDYKMLFGIRR